ncbi:Kinesin-associated protein 3, partial [Clonorchis sinensis]
TGSLSLSDFRVMGDAQFVKRKIRGGSLDVHPTEKALVVHYETEATIVGELGIPVVGDRKESQKIIRVRNLNEQTDIPELARKIVDNCKLIHETKLPQVEHLLRYLLNRKDTGVQKIQPEPNSEKLADPGAFDSTEIDEVAHLTDLDEYLELLYEDIPDKLRASALVLQLARNPDNLEELFQNETLVGALARVLREDWKKSTDLATNITYIFFCFSSFSNFHGVILHFKIGALTMSIIEHELCKYDLWMEELRCKKQVLQEATDDADSSYRASAQSSYESTLSKFNVLVRKQEQLFRVAFYMLLNISEDLSVEVKMHNKGVVSMLCRCLDRENFELLILIVSFLKKLSIFSENKDDMLKHGLIGHSPRLLSRPERDLVNVTLRLLFNLSFDKTARIQMVSSGLVTRLVELLADEDNRSVVFYVLYHLSIEDESKPAFAKTNCLATIMKLALGAADQMSEPVPMALAINLACNEQCASRFAEGKGIRLLMKRALKTRDPLLMKFLRNISEHGDDLKMKFVDHLPDLVKVVVNGEPCRNKKSVGAKKTEGSASLRAMNDRTCDSPTDTHRQSSRPHPFSSCAGTPTVGPTNTGPTISFDDDEDDFGEENEFGTKDEDFVLECLGCLANLSLKDLDFSRILTELGLLQWIKQRLSVRESSAAVGSISGISPYDWDTDDDVLLEVIKLTGTICQDPAAAEKLSHAEIVEKLINILKLKQEDDEIVCQIVHVFYYLVFHKRTIEMTVKSTQVPAYLIDLMHDKNAEIRRVCDLALDIIAEYDRNWGTRIQAERFRWHNSQWLDMIDSATNHTIIGNDPTTDAVMTAALATGHARAQHRRSIPSGLRDIEDEDDSQTGMEMAIDDATAFLMSLHGSSVFRKTSADREGNFGLGANDITYLNQLELMYPDMYGDLTHLGTEALSPPLTRSSPLVSDFDENTPTEVNIPSRELYATHSGGGDQTCNGNQSTWSLNNVQK